MLSEKKREIKTWARFIGTDLDAFKSEETDPDNTNNIIPYSAIAAPDAYKALREHAEGSHAEDAVPDEDYERQCMELEQAGGLTEIDALMSEAIQQAQEKKNREILDKEKEIAKIQEEPVFPEGINRGTRRRPRVIKE